ncbi:tRNA(Met) cytidine acetyltransferase TmcA [Thermogladius sp. 4427co]|uniref:tRNA(Met) cytidine acetyltransferase TmcA n=1 Tax=Thermogladius sp. 4427co TaxID=3450718 RepID=UPI003F7A3453
MNEKIPSSFNRFLATIGKFEEFLVNKKLRGLLVISGGDPAKLGLLAARAISYHEKVRHRYDKKRYTGLYVYHDEFPDAENTRRVFENEAESFRYTEFEFDVYEKSEKYLGKTYSYLILDLTHDLKPNDVGRLTGIVEGGGLVIFLTPKWDTWDNYLTLFKQNLTVPQYPEPRHVFITWFKRKLLQHEGIGIYDAESDTIIKKFSLTRERYKGGKSSQDLGIPEETLFPKKLYELALTRDQVNVIKLMEEMYEKPKGRKVLVVTADRGRGKSCAVAIGSVGLIYLLSKIKPKPRVAVTAPSPGSVQSFFTLAMKALDTLGFKYNAVKKSGDIIELRGSRFSIEYWEPVAVPKIKADLVVVDEASGIHVPMLFKIWEAHKRSVFATTIHGYEGAGRGFSVRFLRRIKSDKLTEVLEYEMTEPIRYGMGDPVEEWSFKTLLLDAEPAELNEEDLKCIEEKRLKYVSYTPQYLFSEEGEEELRQLFGIYVLAHYRNEPDDLGMLADAPHHIIRAVKTETGKIVCAIQVAEEGPIPGSMIEELLKGGRIPGNIIPDRVLKHTRLREFGELKGWRIVRIATHPSVQGKGIGSWGLSKLVEEASLKGLDWIASGFGVNEELLRFWLKNGFKVIHISPDRNPVSGEYTILVIKPINDRAARFVSISEREFKQKLLLSIPVNYRDMEPEVAKLMLDSTAPLIESLDKKLMTQIQVDRLWVYCLGPMTFEAAADLMFKLANIYFSLPPDSRPKLSRLQELVLIAKALQGRSWEELEALFKKPSKELHKIAHDIACELFESITGVKPEEYKPGVSVYEYVVDKSRLLF